MNRHESAHLRKGCHASSENSSPDKLDGNRNAIRGVIRPVLGCVVENVGEEDTNSDGPLVETDDCTTDPLGSAFGLIHWNQSGNQTDAKTSKDTTYDEERKGSCRGLLGNADGEDRA